MTRKMEEMDGHIFVNIFLSPMSKISAFLFSFVSFFLFLQGSNASHPDFHRLDLVASLGGRDLRKLHNVLHVIKVEGLSLVSQKLGSVGSLALHIWGSCASHPQFVT